MALLGSTNIPQHQPLQEWPFLELPLELRHMIWNFTLPTHQMHILRNEKVGEDIFVEIYIPLPVALQVCKESRKALLSRLTAIPRTSRSEDEREVYCDLSSDSLFLDYSISSIVFALDVVPDKWLLFKQLCVPPLVENRRYLETTKKNLALEVERLARTFTSFKEILLAKFLAPHNKLIPRRSGRISMGSRCRHRLALACVGETANQVFPDQIAEIQDDANLLSMNEEHQLWVDHLAKHAEGARVRVHFAIVNVSCEGACHAD